MKNYSNKEGDLMLINGWKTLIIRCNHCGKLQEYDFNIFEIMSNCHREFQCSCGNKVVAIDTKPNRTGYFKLTCFTCGDEHLYKFHVTDLFTNDKIYNCYYGDEICFIGNRKAENRLLLEEPVSVEKIFRKKNIMNYFTDFKIITTSLHKLGQMERNGLVSCECGSSRIEIKLFFDRIELKCEQCNSVKIIYAETEEDLNVLINKDRIVLREQNISCIDSMGEKMRDFKKK